MSLEHFKTVSVQISALTLEDQISKSKKLSTEDRIMTAITTICPSVTSMVPKVRVPET